MNVAIQSEWHATEMHQSTKSDAITHSGATAPYTLTGTLNGLL